MNEANVVRGPHDGAFIPAPPEQHEWMMLVTYSTNDPDSSHTSVYHWQDGRWVYQTQATHLAASGVMNK